MEPVGSESFSQAKFVRKGKVDPFRLSTVAESGVVDGQMGGSGHRGEILTGNKGRRKKEGIGSERLNLTGTELGFGNSGGGHFANMGSKVRKLFKNEGEGFPINQGEGTKGFCTDICQTGAIGIE